MKSEFICPVSGCDASFFTEKGLDFHMVSNHSESEKPKIESKSKSKVKVKTSAPKPAKKKQSKRIAKLNKLAKSRFVPANLKEGDKVSKKKLCTLFPTNQVISKFHEGRRQESAEFSKLISAGSYKVTKVAITRGKMTRYTLESKKLRIIWVEGETTALKNNFLVGRPNVIQL